MRYILWAAALRGGRYVIKLSAILDFTTSENLKEKRKSNFFLLNIKNVTQLNILPVFVHILYFFGPKKGKNTHLSSKWLHHLLLVTSYLVTIATDAHQSCVKMCVRDVRTATENGRWR